MPLDVLAKIVVVLGNVLLVAIRAPFGQRSRSVPVAKSRKGPLERVLLAAAFVGFVVPLVWFIWPTPFSFAGYEPRVIPLGAGVGLMATGLYLLYRSHKDLGRNWSVTLELREKHELVATGVYARVRHPMYAAFLYFGLGQALALPNWAAGPAYFVAMALLVALRLGPEERMMREQFGAQYDAHAAKTKRLIPNVW